MKDDTNHILFIDDDVENLHTLKITFRDIFNVHIASNSKSALDILYNEDIKVVLADQQMPDITGLELCKLVNKKYSHIICIIITAYSNHDLLHQAINQGGIYQLVLKPWNRENLRHIINNAIEKHDLVKQNKQLIEDLELKNKELLEKNEVLTITSDVLKQSENELHEHNKELQKAKINAEESDRLKTAFLGNISHEIRTPLNGILGFIELLSKSPNEQFSQKGISFMKIIKQSSNQLLSIINDLIDISKIEAGSVFIKEDEFDGNDIINALQRDFSSKFKQQDILFITSNLLKEKIFTDKHKLLQILKHLIDNSLKYTSFGSVKLCIIREGKNVKFVVTDTGIGIAESNLEVIWDRFTQLDLGKTTVNMGNGIGLTLVKSFIEVLNGTITLNSKLGEGTEFTVLLPFKTKEEVFNILHEPIKK